MKLQSYNVIIGDNKTVHATVGNKPVCGAGEHTRKRIIQTHRGITCQRCTAIWHAMKRAPTANERNEATPWSIGYLTGYRDSPNENPYYEGNKYRSWQRGYDAGRDRRLKEKLFAHDLGTSAHCNGIPKSQNPFPANGQKAREWAKGWQAEYDRVHQEPETDLLQIFLSGKEAGMNGQSWDNNPFDRGTEEWRYWEHGRRDGARFYDPDESPKEWKTI